MTDLTDLRTTLDEQARGLETDHGARIGDIHARVRGVRRRRRTAAATATAGVAAVLVTVAGVSLAPGDGPGPEPATEVVGVQPPATLTSLGLTYELAGTAEGSGPVGLRLSTSDEPRLVSWATSGDDPTVEVDEGTGADAVTYTDADFTNWVLVPAGAPADVRVRAAAGQAGLAYYTLGEDRPAGVTRDGVTFRRQIAGGELVDAAIGEPGQSEVTVTGVAAGEGLGFSYYCSGGPSDAYLHVGTPGEGDSISSRSCADQAPVDPASSITSSFRARPGEPVRKRLYVTSGGPDGPRIEAPGLRLGLGVYSLDSYGGTRTYVPEVLEDGGHTWRRASLQEARAGEGAFEVRAPADGSAVLAVAYLGAGNGRTMLSFSSGNSASYQGGGASRSVVSPGGEVRISAGSGARPDAGRGIAFYVRAD